MLFLHGTHTIYIHLSIHPSILEEENHIINENYLHNYRPSGECKQGLHKNKVDLVQKYKINIYSLPPAESNYSLSVDFIFAFRNMKFKHLNVLSKEKDDFFSLY